MARWMKVCSDCWYSNRPTEYFPEGETADCDVCGWTGFCTSVSPKDWNGEDIAPVVRLARAGELPVKDLTARFTK